MIKGLIQEEDITIVNIYAPNIGAPQYTRQMLTDIKGEIDSNTIIVEDFLKFIYLFIYFWLHWVFIAVRGLLSSCSEWGLLFVAVRGLLIAVGSLVAEHRLSSCGTRAQLLCSMWNPPGPGLKPMSPALAGRLPTTAPPGKPVEDVNTPLTSVNRSSRQRINTETQSLNDI